MALSIVKPIAEHLHNHKAAGFSATTSVDALASLMAATVDDDLLSKWINTVKPCAPGPTFADVIYDNLLQHMFDEIIPAVDRQFKLLK